MTAINLRLSIRAVMLTLVTIIAACHDEPTGASSDMAVCDGVMPPASPTSCGPETCPAGQICFIEHPGTCWPDLAPPPADGGGGSGGGGGPNTCVEYRCVAPPAACDCHRACSSLVGANPIICSVDGPTLSCTYN